MASSAEADVEEEVVADNAAKGSRVSGAARDKLGNDLRKKYEGGKSIRELAAETGRSYGFVHRVLTESGATLRGRGGAPKSRSTKKKSSK